MPMSPEDMQAMQGKEQEGPGDATALVQKGGEILAQLAEMLNGSQGTTDQDRDQMAQIISLFTDLAEKKLSQAPGQDAPAEEVQAQAPMSAEGGLNGVPMGPQGMARK